MERLALPMKKTKRKRVKAKKKLEVVRSHLEAINLHCALLTAALRNLADKIDDVRSFHLLDKKKP